MGCSASAGAGRHTAASPPRSFRHTPGFTHLTRNYPHLLGAVEMHFSPPTNASVGASRLSHSKKSPMFAGTPTTCATDGFAERPPYTEEDLVVFLGIPTSLLRDTIRHIAKSVDFLIGNVVGELELEHCSFLSYATILAGVKSRLANLDENRWLEDISPDATTSERVSGLVKCGIRLLALLCGTEQWCGSSITETQQKYSSLASVNNLVHALQITSCNPSGTVTVEDAEAEMQALQEVLMVVGVVESAGTPRPFLEWIESLNFIVLDCQSKALLWMVGCVLAGQKPLELSPLHRSSVIADALAICRQQNALDHLDGKRKVQPYSLKLFPKFVSTKDRAIEGGVGHGPRKEFFHLVADEMVSSLSSPHEVHNIAQLHLVEGSRIARIVLKHYGTHKHLAELSAGSNIAVPGHNVPDGFSATVYSVQRKPPEIELELSTAATTSACETVFVVRNPAHPLFSAESSSVWFHAGVEEVKAGKAGAPLTELSPQWYYERFYFCGWLLGVAIANNTTLPITFPSVLFKMLKDNNYTPTKSDLVEVDASLEPTIAKIYSMSKKDFLEVLASLDMPESTTPDEYVASMVDEIVVSGVKSKIDAIRSGLDAFATRESVFWKKIPPGEIRQIMCGRGDDGESGFSFSDEFVLMFDEDMRSTEYNQLFATVIVEVLEQLPARDKRAVLKFITGRGLLSPAPKTDIIKIELPFTGMTPKDFDRLQHRLPSSHTCDNVLELPPYLECMFLRPGSDCYSALPKDVKILVDEDKKVMWDAVPASRRNQIVKDTKALLKRKLVLAASNTDSYELDDVAQVIFESSSIAATPINSHASEFLDESTGSVSEAANAEQKHSSTGSVHDATTPLSPSNNTPEAEASGGAIGSESAPANDRTESPRHHEPAVDANGKQLSPDDEAEVQRLLDEMLSASS